MENYPEHIYPTLPKDGDGETFRLQQTCVALQKLENEAKHYEAVRKKYKRYHDFLSKVFCINWNTFFYLECIWCGNRSFRCWSPCWCITGSDWVNMWYLERVYGSSS